MSSYMQCKCNKPKPREVTLTGSSSKKMVVCAKCGLIPPMVNEIIEKLEKEKQELVNERNEAWFKVECLEEKLKTARRDAIHDAIKATKVKIYGGHALIHKTSDLEAFADSQLD